MKNDLKKVGWALLIGLIFYACKKELVANGSKINPKRVTLDELMLATDGVFANGNEKARRSDTGKHTALWSKAYSIRLKDSSNVLHVPLLDNGIDKLNGSRIHLVAFKDSLGKIQTSLMVIRPIDGDVSALTKPTTLKDFTGDILTYSLNNVFLRGHAVINGRIAGEVKIDKTDISAIDEKGLVLSKGKIMAISGRDIPNKISGWEETCVWRQGSSYVNAEGELVIVSRRFCSWSYKQDPNIPDQEQIDYIEPPEYYGGERGYEERTDTVDCAGVLGGTAHESSCGCVGGTTGISECQLDENKEFQRSIVDTALKPCMKSVLTAIRDLNTSIPVLIREFSINQPGFNWTVKDGRLDPDINGLTTGYNRTTFTVTTTFDSHKFTSGTDLAIARTIMHEGIHAYLVTYFGTDYAMASKTYSELFTEWTVRNKASLNDIHHNEFVRNFVDKLATSLQEYGDSKGYTFTYGYEKAQYYQDLAWGGLTDTQAFKALNITDQNRIKDRLATEQYGVDRNGNTKAPKGGTGGCVI